MNSYLVRLPQHAYTEESPTDGPTAHPSRVCEVISGIYVPYFVFTHVTSPALRSVGFSGPGSMILCDEPVATP